MYLYMFFLNGALGLLAGTASLSPSPAQRWTPPGGTSAASGRDGGSVEERQREQDGGGGERALAVRTSMFLTRDVSQSVNGWLKAVAS